MRGLLRSSDRSCAGFAALQPDLYVVSRACPTLVAPALYIFPTGFWGFGTRLVGALLATKPPASAREGDRASQDPL